MGWVSGFVCLATLFSVCGHSAPFSKCDVNQSGAITVTDVQAVINEALGTSQSKDDLNTDGAVNVVDAEIDLYAALNGVCTADPGLVSILPNTGQQGASGLAVAITGRLTAFSNSSVINLGAGITVSNVAASSPTALTATLAIDPAAAATARDLTVDSFTLPGAFTVTPPVSVSFTYDSQGRLSTATYIATTGVMTVVTYSYDAAGNRTSVVAR